VELGVEILQIMRDAVENYAPSFRQLSLCAGKLCTSFPRLCVTYFWCLQI